MEKIITGNIDMLFQRAKAFEDFRNNCKVFLAKHNRNFDKFTVVSHDSLIGYITEKRIKHYFEISFPNCKVLSWDENFDIRRIMSIIKARDLTEADINYVQKYFYDNWDLQITYNSTIINADVKTALTQKEPASSWNFMYPVVQAEKEGKDVMILVYYVTQQKEDLQSLKELVLAGYTTPDKVKTCPVISAGKKTRYGTISQVDNYETELATTYFKLQNLFAV